MTRRYDQLCGKWMMIWACGPIDLLDQNLLAHLQMAGPVAATRTTQIPCFVPGWAAALSRVGARSAFVCSLKQNCNSERVLSVENLLGLGGSLGVSDMTIRLALEVRIDDQVASDLC